MLECENILEPVPKIMDIWKLDINLDAFRKSVESTSEKVDNIDLWIIVK